MSESNKNSEKNLKNQVEAEVAALDKENKPEEAPKKKGRPSKVSSGSISMYLAEIGRYNPLAPDREVELAIRIQKGDERAMKELVEANLGDNSQGCSIKLTRGINIIVAQISIEPVTFSFFFLLIFNVNTPPIT